MRSLRIRKTGNRHAAIFVVSFRILNFRSNSRLHKERRESFSYHQFLYSKTHERQRISANCCLFSSLPPRYYTTPHRRLAFYLVAGWIPKLLQLVLLENQFSSATAARKSVYAEPANNSHKPNQNGQAICRTRRGHSENEWYVWSGCLADHCCFRDSFRNSFLTLWFVSLSHQTQAGYIRPWSAMWMRLIEAWPLNGKKRRRSKVKRWVVAWSNQIWL